MREGRCATRQQAHFLERESHFGEHLSLDDVSEDVLPDVLIGEVGDLDAREQPVTRPPDTQGGADECVRLGRTVEALIENIRPNAHPLGTPSRSGSERVTEIEPALTGVLVARLTSYSWKPLVGGVAIECSEQVRLTVNRHLQQAQCPFPSRCRGFDSELEHCDRRVCGLQHERLQRASVGGCRRAVARRLREDGSSVRFHTPRRSPTSVTPVPVTDLVFPSWFPVSIGIFRRIDL